MALHKEWNVPGGSRYDSKKLNPENPFEPEFTVGQLKKAMEASNAFYSEVVKYHQNLHNQKNVFVRKIYYGKGEDDFAYDTLDGYSNESAKKAQLAPVIPYQSGSHSNSYWREKGQAQKKKQ